MIDLREIKETIDKIKRNGTSIEQAETLALLYIAADHMERENAAQTAQNHAYAAATHTNEGMPGRNRPSRTSEFIAACEAAQMGDVLDILDEHMEVIRVLYPKEYAEIMRRIGEKR